MSLSKPFVGLLTSYLQNLYLNPVRTKSITSAIIAAAGSLTSQLVGGGGNVNVDNVIAYGLYGLLFGGSIPHYFYCTLEKLFPSEVVAYPIAKQILFERLVFAPLYQAFSLYMLARLEGKNHDVAVKQLKILYWPVLEANWRWLTFFQFINIAFVPELLRVVYSNVIGFFWAVFIAKRRRDQSRSEKSM